MGLAPKPTLWYHGVQHKETKMEILSVKPRNPDAIWDIGRLKTTPRTRPFPMEFRGEATPVFLEGEPWRGRKTWCFAYYGLPEWATPTHPAPGIVLAHGGLGTAYPEWVRAWVRRGYAAICVDNCGGLPIRTADEQWLANPDGGPRGWGRVECADEPKGDQWVFHAVAAILRSHSFLRSLPGVDTRAIGLTGVSWGGFLACIAAAADDRFAYAAPVYGCGFNHEPGGLAAGQPLSEKWAALWDASAFLPFVKCPMLWVDSTNDFAFAPDRVRRSASLAPVPHVFSTHLRMHHGHTEGERPPEILVFANHYARGGADVVRIGPCQFVGDRVKVAFDAAGRTIARAEFLYTADGAAVPWQERRWRFIEAEALDTTAGTVSTALPCGTFACVINLVTDDGLVFSSPYGTP